MGLETASSLFWKNKKVFLTGHTGFKGSWLSLCLIHLGAQTKGYSLNPITTPNLFTEANLGKTMESFIGDIRDLSTLKKQVSQFDPDILIHMAAQPLVKYSYKNPIETYETNVIGTANVLEASRHCKRLKAIVNVTTDKCYENKEWEWGYRESDQLGGFDPYSSSKACSEIITSAFRKSFFNNIGIGLSTARSGNVIGGGDWSEDRIVPDILRAFEENKSASIRNPESIRPWQHVLEPLFAYLLLAQHLHNAPADFSESWNFGPNDIDSKPVKWIADEIVNRWHTKATWETTQKQSDHEAKYLKLDISKAKKRLNWEPIWNINYSIERTIRWHLMWLNGDNARTLCLGDIEKYLDDMNSNEN